MSLAPASTASAAPATEPSSWTPRLSAEGELAGRLMETYTHDAKPAWGYAGPQTDTFIVLRPAEPPAGKVPLYVVLHSAGHDVKSCVACTTKVGNHDIYRSPPGFLALYLDCRANKGDWWWGSESHKGPEPGPTERRVVDTVLWAITKFDADPDRVYLCGNSMGGSGALGIGMRRGDVFAAIKANVPAKVEHVSSRMYFPPAAVPADVELPDPPVVVDYSAQNDTWSKGHETFARAMDDRRYALYLYWGPFGHANNSEAIKKVNDLIDSFDWLEVRRNRAYPAFTAATTNDELPWPAKPDDKRAGQVNAYFRWTKVSDAPAALELSLFLATPETLKTRFAIPTETTADVTVRRPQAFKVPPGAEVKWTFGTASGVVKADAQGRATVPRLKVTATPVTLRLERAN